MAAAFTLNSMPRQPSIMAKMQDSLSRLVKWYWILFLRFRSPYDVILWTVYNRCRSCHIQPSLPLRMLVMFFLGIVKMPYAAYATPSHPWSRDDRFELVEAIIDSARDGLRPQDYDLKKPGYATEDQVNDVIAMALAHDLREGRRSTPARLRRSLSRMQFNYHRWLERALRTHTVLASLRALRPTNPAYAALGAAYLHCEQPDPCRTLQANLERWRRLPRQFGTHYLWVNIADHRVDLVDSDRVISSYRAIVGAPTSPTPLFNSMVTAIIVIPRQHGAVKIGDGHHAYQTKSGTFIKLEIANSDGRGLRDVEDQNCSEMQMRARPQGCIAIPDLKLLVAGILGTEENADLEDVLKRGVYRRFTLGVPVGIFVTYFTAEPDETGNIIYHPDVYHCDGLARGVGGQ